MFVFTAREYSSGQWVLPQFQIHDAAAACFTASSSRSMMMMLLLATLQAIDLSSMI